MHLISMFAAALVAGCLLVLATIHVYWGLGGRWPARTRDELGPMIVGTPPSTPMPSLFACLIVAGLLSAAALLVAMAGFLPKPSWVWRVGSIAVSVVLALRGLGGYVDGRLRPETRMQPFYSLNRTLYSPLCLSLAALIVLVLL